MKITATQYAKALYETTSGKPSAEVDLMVENFIKILRKNNQMKLANSVIEKFSAIHNVNHGIVDATVVSAVPLGEKSLEDVRKFVTQKYSANQVVLTNEVEKRIRGGIIIRVGDEMIDASVVRRLLNLKKELIT